jgi:thiosulfate/3-mercaptopyruvate sulfurtransferase
MASRDIACYAIEAFRHERCFVKEFFAVALLLALFLTPPGTLGQKAPTKAAASQERVPMLVTTDWLSEHLSDPSLVLLQIGEKNEYAKAHIPGAQFLEYDSISTPHGQGLMLELPPVEQLVSVFENLGVSNRSHVVLFFGNDRVTPTTRVYWTLDYLGLGDRTSILDGGLPAWRSAGRPIAKDQKRPPKGSITPAPRKEIVADAAWVSSHLSQPGITILDARTPEFYTGKESDGNPRDGHIPGAENLSYLSVVNEDTNKFKNPDQLKALFSAAGLKPGNLMVSYCHIGQRATILYFTAKMLGFDAKMYDGSWEDWSHRKDLPIVKGDQPGKP